MKLLAAAGDIGGARALAPVLFSAASRGDIVYLVKNGAIVDEHCNKEVPWNWIAAHKAPDEIINEIRPDFYIFATSLRDMLALNLAQAAQKSGYPTLHLLDNWASYTRRLQVSKTDVFIPDIYAVMDQKAAEEVEGAGIPTDRIRITGTPALGNLQTLTHSNIARNRIVFISEPVASDQGESPKEPLYRGYTERTVLIEILAALNARADAENIRLHILPHPREEREGLLDLWENYSGTLSGGVAFKNEASDKLANCDAVIGMSSILVLKSWLCGLPTLSVQPNLRLPELTYLKGRPGLGFVEDLSEMKTQIDNLLSDNVISDAHLNLARVERMRHNEASLNILNCLDGVV